MKSCWGYTFFAHHEYICVNKHRANGATNVPSTHGGHLNIFKNCSAVELTVELNFYKYTCLLLTG